MSKPIKKIIGYDDFEKIDLRIGKVVQVEDFPEAQKPAYKLWVDFGEKIGIRQSSAQIKKNQSKEELLGKLVVCVVNFNSRQVGPFRSDVLVLGAADGTNDLSNWIILTTGKEVPLGEVVG